MKPSRFAYHDPRTVPEALALLHELGDDAKVLAGGQSLMPMLNLRLARPEALIDINQIDALDEIALDEGTLRFGALIRHVMLERSPWTAQGWPIIPAALRHVAHPQIRNRGTVLGSVAHADPAAEMPVVLTALDARFEVRSVAGTREIVAADFFRSQMTTALEPTELLIACTVPALPPNTGCGFHEFARRHGDFALGGAAVVLTLAPDGTCADVRITLLGAGAVPVRAREAEAALRGHRLGDAAAEIARIAVGGIEPIAATVEEQRYRRRVVGVMCARSLESAQLAAEEAMQ